MALVIEHHIHLAPETKAWLGTLIRPLLRGLDELEQHMSKVDDALAAIGSSVDELVKDVQRLIDAFTAAGELTPEQQAAVDALQGKLTAIDTAVEAADPEPAPAPEV